MFLSCRPAHPLAVALWTITVCLHHIWTVRGISVWTAAGWQDGGFWSKLFNWRHHNLESVLILCDGCTVKGEVESKHLYRCQMVNSSDMCSGFAWQHRGSSESHRRSEMMIIKELLCNRDLLLDGTTNSRTKCLIFSPCKATKLETRVWKCPRFAIRCFNYK